MRLGVEGGDPDLCVVSVGEALIDLIALQASDLQHAEHFVRAAGGAPANVAVAAGRLGSRSALVSCVADDPFGRHLVGLLKENGVLTDAVVMADRVTAATTVSVVAANSGGIPDFVFYRGADALLQPSDIPEELICRSRFIYVSSMALTGEPAASATRHAADLAKRIGVLVTFDPNLRPSSWPSQEAARRAISPLLKLADVLKVNEEEALLLTGCNSVAEAVHALSGGSGDRLVAVTLAGEGCVWRRGNDSGTVSAPAVEVADTTGAGDAFVGSLLAELCRRHPNGTLDSIPVDDVETSLHFGCAAAAFSCTKAGAMVSLPNREQVESLLSAR
jgi:fructokinase